LRLYKNNEFAFKEVVNKKTFDENCNVIRDVVRLLQYKRIRYSTKQQFLGDFFEKLLNTSVKQETGQYFTPIPITKFICNALPIEKIITNKIKNHEDKFLPYAIDFASGSGHFLTEYMDRVDCIVKSTNEEGMRTSAKSNIKIWKDNYKWASEFVYGIEKDYRLAKTTKISCFLNGDGEANIIYGDGLDNFNNSNVFTGILKKDYQKQRPNTSVNSTDKSLNKFDVVIANPPYSVPGFKHTLNFGESSFDLFKYVDEKSGAIECFFIERAIQLLNDKGVAGVVLPISLLNNSGIYTETRKLLLEATKIKAIVEFGSGTFMATQTNTIVIFFEKRNDKDSIQLKEGINQAFEKKEDRQISEIKNAIDIYTNFIYDIGATEYFNIFENFYFSIQSTDWLTDYFEFFAPKSTNLDSLKDPKILESFKNFVIEKEKEKIHTYLLIHGQNLVVSQSPTVKREEKKFLGYEFSKRRGNEGIKISRNDDGSIKSALYSEKNIDDQLKINFWIKRNFENNILTTSNHNLPNNTEVLPFADLIDFSANFEAQINLSAISQKNYWESYNKKVIGKNSSNFSLIKIKDIEHVEVDSGNGAPQGDKYFEGGKHLFVRVSSLNVNKNNEVHSDPVSMINDNAVKDYNLKLFKKGTIVFPKSGKAIETNKIAILMSDCYVVSHLATIFIKNELIRDYVFNYLKHFKTSNLAKRSGYPTIGVAEIKKFKIPYPMNNHDQTFTDWIASIKKVS
jgi:type I restriction enzyme M protein